MPKKLRTIIRRAWLLTSLWATMSFLTQSRTAHPVLFLAFMFVGNCLVVAALEWYFKLCARRLNRRDSTPQIGSEVL